MDGDGIASQVGAALAAAGASAAEHASTMLARAGAWLPATTAAAASTDGGASLLTTLAKRVGAAHLAVLAASCPAGVHGLTAEVLLRECLRQLQDGVVAGVVRGAVSVASELTESVLEVVAAGAPGVLAATNGDLLAPLLPPPALVPQLLAAAVPTAAAPAALPHLPPLPPPAGGAATPTGDAAAADSVAAAGTTATSSAEAGELPRPAVRGRGAATARRRTPLALFVSSIVGVQQQREADAQAEAEATAAAAAAAATGASSSTAAGAAGARGSSSSQSSYASGAREWPASHWDDARHSHRRRPDPDRSSGRSSTGAADDAAHVAFALRYLRHPPPQAHADDDGWVPAPQLGQGLVTAGLPRLAERHGRSFRLSAWVRSLPCMETRPGRDRDGATLVRLRAPPLLATPLPAFAAEAPSTPPPAPTAASAASSTTSVPPLMSLPPLPSLPQLLSSPLPPAPPLHPPPLALSTSTAASEPAPQLPHALLLPASSPHLTAASTTAPTPPAPPPSAPVVAAAGSVASGDVDDADAAIAREEAALPRRPPGPLADEQFRLLTAAFDWTRGSRSHGEPPVVSVYGREVCRAFTVTGGSCAWGGACRQVHMDAGWRPARPFDAAVLAAQRRAEDAAAAAAGGPGGGGTRSGGGEHSAAAVQQPAASSRSRRGASRDRDHGSRSRSRGWRRSRSRSRSRGQRRSSWRDVDHRRGHR